MKKQPQTVIETLAARVREQARRYNPALESPPTAVLWTDERRDWEGVLPQLQSALPELFVLGAYQPAQRSGPGAWLRMVADGQAGGLPKGTVPLLYLPGVGNGSLRTDLRGLKDDPQLAPISELQYRGTFWRQDNSKDWTLRAFFESKRGGLGMAVKGDQATLAALKQALPRLLGRSLMTLETRQIDLAFLDEILNPNPADDVLRWMVNPAGLQGEKGDTFDSFVASTRARYGVDLGKGVLDAAAQVLAAREADPAYGLWEKFVHRPQELPALYDVFKAVPKKDLLSGAERYPRENEADEATLADALKAVAAMDTTAAATKLQELEAQHAPRRGTVWSRLGRAPLAEVLAPLAVVARAVQQPAVGGSVQHQAAVWASDGWSVDAAALQALALAQTANRQAEVEPALAAVYRPWLQRSAEAFQQRVKAEGYPDRASDDVPEGTVLLFVDGLRLDLARQLQQMLSAPDLTVDLQHRFTSVPSVTSSGKVWCSPGYAAAQPAATAMGFEPVLKVNGANGDYTAERLRRAIQAEGYTVVDSEAPAIASGRGWAEFADDIDSDGHNKGLRLAEEAPRHLSKLAKTVQRLLSAGWQRVRVITDHGWLLLPGGLPKVELPAKLTEAKWARCAVVKDAAAAVDAMTLPWSYGPSVRIALAPGIGAFRAGQVYDHGGLTLQECVVPVVDVTSASSAAGRPRLKAVSWNARKTLCKVEAVSAEGLTVAVERLGIGVGEPGIVDVHGKGMVEFEDVDEFIGEIISLVLRRDGQKVAEEPMKFGEAWHAAG
ncbi:MAG: BREX-1 system phosphatase PglZ type B [Nevskia sp.]|nr:BREX-1 system phosphatase PglZ type B [Nevskia sp.]